LKQTDPMLLSSRSI